MIQAAPSEAGACGSVLDCRLQCVVEELLDGAVVIAPFRTERRSLFYLSQGRKKRTIQLSCIGSFHRGFDNEVVACFLDGAGCGQLFKSMPDGFCSLQLRFDRSADNANLPRS